MEREKIYLARQASTPINALITLVIALNTIAILVGCVLLYIGSEEYGSVADTFIGIAIYLIIVSILALIFIPKLLRGVAEITKCAENINAYFRQKYELVEKDLKED